MRARTLRRRLVCLVLPIGMLTCVSPMSARGRTPATAGSVVPRTTLYLRRDRPGWWRVRASYPRFDSASPVSRLANRTVAARIRQDISVFTDYALKHPENRLPNAPFGQRSTATVTLSRSHLVSLYRYVDEFLGGAHGNQYYEPLSFGLVHGRPRRLRLEDLFRRGQRARSVCADRVFAKLRNNPRADSVRDGTVTRAKLAGQKLKFVITPTGLLFLFDPYELGSYAAGSFEAPVRFEEFGGALDRSGPLKPLLASRRWQHHGGKARR